MAKRSVVKVTANFKRNLDHIEAFLTDADAPHTFDDLLDELADAVIPNLEEFPGMGRSFMQRPAASVEARNAMAALGATLATLTSDRDAIREYVMRHYLVLYAPIGDTVHLLAIRHQRQLSFDFEAHWHP